MTGRADDPRNADPNFADPNYIDPNYVEYASALARALVEALPGWVERCVTRVYAEVMAAPLPDEVAAEAVSAGRRALDESAPAIFDLLARDIDDQPTTPLALVRLAVRYPTEVLARAGVPPVARDGFAARNFPSDLYDLSPATFADISPAAAEAGIAWGAAKAFEHKRRHSRPSA